MRLAGLFRHRWAILLALALITLTSALYAWLPPAPRWAIPGEPRTIA